jgi:hypothetical protein
MRERQKWQPVTNALPFRPTVCGTGKWHVSYADVYGAAPTEWVVDPRIAPACGSSPVELDPNSPPITPVVGEPILKYIELLCRRCIGIRRKGNMDPFYNTNLPSADPERPQVSDTGTLFAFEPPGQRAIPVASGLRHEPARDHFLSENPTFHPPYQTDTTGRNRHHRTSFLSYPDVSAITGPFRPNASIS